MNNLISLYQKQLNLFDATFSLIEHEDATVALVYKISRPNGQQFILKICVRPQDFAREYYFLTYFAGILPVPSIIEVVQPGDQMHGALLMEYVAGAPIKITDSVSDEVAYELGVLLSRIHANRTAGYGELVQTQNLQPRPHDYFSMKFEEGLAECANHLPQELLDKSRNYYQTHLHLLDSVDGPCMVHNDYRAGNILVYDGKFQAIIDWSGARASFAEKDFCHLEHGSWPKSFNKQAFLNGYAAVRPVPDYHRIMPLLRLSKAIGTIGFTVKRNIWQDRNANLYQYNRQYLESFFQNN